MKISLRTCLAVAVVLAIGVVFPYAEENAAKSSKSASKPAATFADCGTGSVAVKVAPEHADILVDGSFVGNSPATLKLAPGKHTIKVTAPGYGEWQREVTVFGGSQAQLAVTLEKGTDAGPTSPATLASAPITPAVTPAGSTTAATAECGTLGAFSDEHPKNRSDGIKVTGFAPHSPAAKAGLEIGDYIVALAGTYVFTIDDLTAQLCKYKPGSQVALRYRRNAALDETTVVLGP